MLVAAPSLLGKVLYGQQSSSLTTGSFKTSTTGLFCCLVFKAPKDYGSTSKGQIRAALQNFSCTGSESCSGENETNGHYSAVVVKSA